MRQVSRALEDALLTSVEGAVSYENRVIEMVLTLLWAWTDCTLTELAYRAVVARGNGETLVLFDDRIIHRQRWVQTGEYTLSLQMEWCPE